MFDCTNSGAFVSVTVLWTSKGVCEKEIAREKERGMEMEGDKEEGREGRGEIAGI